MFCSGFFFRFCFYVYFCFVLFVFCGRYSVIIQPGDGSQQNSPTKGDTSTSRVDSGESNDEKIVLYLG